MRVFIFGFIGLIVLCLICGSIVIMNKMFTFIIHAKGVLNYNKGLYIKQSNIEGAGRGVFTNEIIEPNQIVEICPVINIMKNDIKNTPLNDYAFGNLNYKYNDNDNENDNKSQLESESESKSEQKDTVIVLGYGSIYNHSDNPNCSHEIDNDDRKMIICSKRRIEKDEELFINYGSKWWSTRAKIKRI